MELSGFFETKEWACRRHAHSVCPDFAREFRNAGALARTVFPPRRRFEIRSEEFALSENTKRIFDFAYVHKVEMVMLGSQSQH